MIRLIIFDLDGTLVDSGVDITNALNHALSPFGGPQLTVKQTIGLVGEGVTRLIEKVAGDDNAGRRDDILERFVAYYSAHLTDETRPYPGVVQTIGKLTGRRKAVISNKREAMSRRLLADLGLMRYIDVVLGGDSIDEKKPSPKPLVHVMKLLETDPEESVIVGDSIIDVQAGKAAGVKTVAVSYGFRAVDTLRDADVIIDSMEELPAVLERFDTAVR